VPTICRVLEVRAVSLLTDYWFQDSYWYGPFDQYNVPFGNGGWAWISQGGSSAATLSWVREDSEELIDFGEVVGNPAVTGAIDNLLNGSGARRTSGLTAQGMFWRDVPYASGDAGRHQPGDMLVRLYFDVHIHTPAYCTDADATLSYYLLFYLDGSGDLHGSADYATWSFSGGWPVCEGGVNDALRSAMLNGFGTVQGLIDEAIPLLAQGRFSMLYYLPGNGTRGPGNSNQDGNKDVALALLPIGA
jgi:hypothetical protein